MNLAEYRADVIEKRRHRLHPDRRGDARDGTVDQVEIGMVIICIHFVDMFLHGRTPKCPKRWICSCPALGEQV